MKILALHSEIKLYLRQHNLERKFAKQCRLFLDNPRYPSLHFELLEPRHLKIYSFRIDRKYRAILIFRDQKTVEIIDVNNHYA